MTYIHKAAKSIQIENFFLDASNIEDFASAILDSALEKEIAFLWRVGDGLKIFSKPQYQCRVNSRPLRKFCDLGRAEFLGQYDCRARGLDIVDDLKHILQEFEYGAFKKTA